MVVTNPKVSSTFNYLKKEWFKSIIGTGSGSSRKLIFRRMRVFWNMLLLLTVLLRKASNIEH